MFIFILALFIYSHAYIQKVCIYIKIVTIEKQEETNYMKNPRGKKLQVEKKITNNEKNNTIRLIASYKEFNIFQHHIV